MNKITILPDHVASQIAAGEVVERPSSVVKELVENAIDSGATSIDIEISKDARDIRVADNGCGMSPEDATLAFQRHATSKLTSATDLESLSTLGFRGEALPSIASISKFTCLTRPTEAATGTRIEVEDSKIKAVETGCSTGTVMDVRDLFFNVPARLKFLKRATTEIGHIQEIVQSLALSYPQIAFELKFGGSTKLKTSGCGDLLRSIVETKLVKDEANLCKIELNDTVAGVSVFGYAARPTQFRGDRKGILTFVNGRPVRCPLTLKALDYAYSDLIPRGKYPLAVVSIELPQNEIDVNIHPTKKEIKYSNSHNVYTTLHRAIGNALREPRKELVEAMAPGVKEKNLQKSITSPHQLLLLPLLTIRSEQEKETAIRSENRKSGTMILLLKRNVPKQNSSASPEIYPIARLLCLNFLKWRKKQNHKKIWAPLSIPSRPAKRASCLSKKKRSLCLPAGAWPAICTTPTISSRPETASSLSSSISPTKDICTKNCSLPRRPEEEHRSTINNSASLFRWSLPRPRQMF